jgi:transposase-like protein
VELGLVEQRYQAVVEVLEGATVVDVARRFGVARQTVHAGLGNSQATGPLPAGEYSFRGVYSGDSDYAGADGACEQIERSKRLGLQSGR